MNEIESHNETIVSYQNLVVPDWYSIKLHVFYVGLTLFRAQQILSKVTIIFVDIFRLCEKAIVKTNYKALHMCFYKTIY